MARFALVASLAALLMGAALADSPPQPPLPYTTTMLRTHHFATKEFLSIYEQLSVRSMPGQPAVTESAYHIFPGLPFSMRDANNTIVLGIRVVYQDNGTDTTTFYFLTDTDGNERCVRHAVGPSPATSPAVSIGEATIRGIPGLPGWVVNDTSTGVVTTTHYVADEGNDAPQFPFRIELLYPPGGAEVGYLLDHGTHFPQAMTDWFDTSGCDKEPACRADDAFSATHDHWSALAAPRRCKE